MTSSCLFCRILDSDQKNSVVKEFEHCFAMEDKYPVAPGHLLIVPKVHIDDWFDADLPLQHSLISAVGEMKKWLEENYQPEGYNIGINCGRVAGQTIMHLHVHLIPRYSGDVPEPRGGVRGVIPKKQSY